MDIRSWPMDQALKDELDAHYKTRLASLLKEGGAMDVIRTVTFDGATGIGLEDVGRFLAFVDRGFLSGRLKGTGLEAGAGPGTFSALLARAPGVERMYAVDACEAVVRELMPSVVAHVQGGETGKVVGCVGEFDRIGLPDASVDFVFDFFSFHHSVDLGRTFREMARILKPGGFVLCFDKARDDAQTDADLERLLDREYPEAAKRVMGIDPSKRHTRRMNGEKEYRLREWRKAFLENGFAAFEHFHVARVRSRNPLMKAAKRLFSRLPPRLQAHITDLLPLKPQNDLSRSHRVYTPLLERFPREISLMIAWK